MRPARAVLPINAGSDLSFLMVWAGADDQPLDLTGLTIEPFDVHPALSGHLSGQPGQLVGYDDHGLALAVDTPLPKLSSQQW